MTYCKMKKVPLLITQIDFKKAFDSLSWDFMLNVLKSLTLGILLYRALKSYVTG